MATGCSQLRRGLCWLEPGLAGTSSQGLPLRWTPPVSTIVRPLGRMARDVGRFMRGGTCTGSLARRSGLKVPAVKPPAGASVRPAGATIASLPDVAAGLTGPAILNHVRWMQHAMYATNPANGLATSTRTGHDANRKLHLDPETFRLGGRSHQCQPSRISAGFATHLGLRKLHW